MKYHFFANSWRGPSVNEIKNKVSFLNDCGYDSVLMTYQGGSEDYFIKSARALNELEKIKFMIALRPSSLSPEYCAMLISAFNQISPDRLMINFTHGSFSKGEIRDGIIHWDKIFASRESVLSYSDLFLDALTRAPLFQESPCPLVISGASDESIQMAKKYGDYLAIGHDDFYKFEKSFNIGKKLIVAATGIVLNVGSKYVPDSKTMAGTEEDLLSQINNLENSGVTDLMFTDLVLHPNREKIHDFVKNNSKAG